jgi:phosphohistidine phosphatase
MRLYFLRHGPAVAREDWDGAEATRPLTDAGIAVTEQAARGLAALNLGIERVLTSPYARASATAGIVAARLRLPVVEVPPLTSGCDLRRLVPALAEHREARRLLLVGHEPDFSQMIGELIAARGAISLTLKKGGCALVELPGKALDRLFDDAGHTSAGDADKLRGVGTLVWLLTPRQLAAVAAPA